METIEIRRPCSPSTIIDTQTIKATWGGGMGGASKEYYSTKQNGKEWTLLPHGEIITLNDEYIVHKKPVTIVKVVTDVTAHRNYHSNQCNESITTEYILLPFNTTYKLNEVGSGGTNKSVIFSNTITT